MANLRKRYRRMAVWLALCLILAVPFPTVVVPEWKIEVVDTAGQPVKRVTVRETWQHYSLESEGHEEDRSTDDDGCVNFPTRYIWSSLIWRTLSTSVAAISRLGHGSMGASGHAMVVDADGSGWSSYAPNQPSPTVFVIEQEEMP